MKATVSIVVLLLSLASQSVSAACANNKPFCVCNQGNDVCVVCAFTGSFVCQMRLKIKVRNSQAASNSTSEIGSMSAKSSSKATAKTKTKEIEIKNCSDLRKSNDFKMFEEQQKRDTMRFCQKQLKKAKKQLSQ